MPRIDALRFAEDELYLIWLKTDTPEESEKLRDIFYVVASERIRAEIDAARKPSRRERRRARKAAKNAHMWRTAGRRYWNRPWRGKSHDALSESIGFWSRVYRNLDQRIFEVNEAHARIVYHLREPSGFMWMSRVAEEMRLTKAHTPDFVDEVATYTEEQLKAIETWVRESWGDLKPTEIAEKLGMGEL